MRFARIHLLTIGLTFLSALGLGSISAIAQTPATQPTVVRCAVIGGMFDTGFWNDLAERYEKETGVHVQLLASGPKAGISSVFRRGEVDLLTMHACDEIINLVADGLASDPQPWARNDMVIVGPPDDPAKIRGMTDAAAALKKIAALKAPFVVHSSLGTQEVLVNILTPAGIALDHANTTLLFGEQEQRNVLKIAAQKKAYTMVGRIPFRDGKMPNAGMVLMVEGDPRLQRPYVVVVANPVRIPGANAAQARRLAAYLRSPQTQAWIADYGKGRFDDRSIFFPVTIGAEPATQPAAAGQHDAGGSDVLLSIAGEIPSPKGLTAAQLASLGRREVTVKDRSGKGTTYSGVLVGAILKSAGVPLGEKAENRTLAGMFVTAESADGYKVVFALAELDEQFGDRSIILADRRDGAALDARDGPLRLIVPSETEPARWARHVVSLTVGRP